VCVLTSIDHQKQPHTSMRTVAKCRCRNSIVRLDSETYPRMRAGIKIAVTGCVRACVTQRSEQTEIHAPWLAVEAAAPRPASCERAIRATEE
jgi:hypothetical protein